jgi:ABC-type uncharacterized transport system substrate-binding protein
VGSASLNDRAVQRRWFLTALAALLIRPTSAGAQPSARAATIGVLASTRAIESTREAVRSGLREHDYVEGRNIVIEWRDGEGRVDRLATFAGELVRRRVDVIVALLTPAVQAAKNATSTIPIVMAPVGDPVASGFVVSLARPGRNITGVTGLGAELSVKQLEALRQLVPKLARVALLINSAGGAFSRALTTQMEMAARTTSVTLHVIRVSNADELPRAFAAAADQKDHGVIVQGPIFNEWFDRIAQLGLRHHLPVLSAPREFAEAGGLLAYGASQTELTRRAMFYVARILHGTQPADLPVEQPTKFELVINLRTARALGLAVPPALLGRADQVIE